MNKHHYIPRGADQQGRLETPSRIPVGRRRMGDFRGWERVLLCHGRTLAVIAAVCLGYYLARN